MKGTLPGLTIPLLMVAFAAFYLASVAWRRRQIRGAGPFAVLMIGAGIWAFCYALELVSAELSHRILYAKLQYLGIVMIPGSYLSFAIQYTAADKEYKWGKSRPWRLLIQPVLTLLLAGAYPWSRALWADVVLCNVSDLQLAHFVPGPWYWVNVAYSYAGLVASSLLLINAMRSSQDHYQRQSIAMLVTIAAPWVCNILYIAGLTPLQHLDLTPFGFVIAGVAVATGLLRFQLLDIAPLVQQRVVEAFPEAYFVVDPAGRITDCNERALSLLQVEAQEIIQQSVTEILPGLPVSEHDLSSPINVSEEMAWTGTELRAISEAPQPPKNTAQSPVKYIELRISAIRSGGIEHVGSLVILSDITERVTAQWQIMDNNANLERLIAERTVELEQINVQLRQEIAKRSCVQQDLAARISELATLHELGKAATARRSLQNVADHAVQIARRAVDADLTVILLRESDHLKSVSADYKDDIAWSGHDTTEPLGVGLWERAGLSGKPLYIGDVTADPQWGLAECRRAGLHAFAALPLATDDRSLGILGVATMAKRDLSSQSAFLEALAVEVSLGLRNALHFDEIQQRLDELAVEVAERSRIERQLHKQNLQLTTLNTVVTTMSHELETNNAIGLILDELVELPGISATWLHVESTANEITVIPQSRVISPPHIPSLTPTYDRDIETVISTATPKTTALIATPESPTTPVSLIMVPLVAREDVLGVLAALCSPTELTIEENETLLYNVGHHIALGLENVQLREVAAQVELWEEASRLRADLIANVSHEIRTPLGLIKLFASAVQMQGVNMPTEQRQEFLEGIETESNVLEQLVTDLLGLSRYDAGRLTLHRVTLDLRRIVKNAIGTMRLELAQHSLVSHFWSSELVVNADAFRIQQVIRNLLSNAIKYSPENSAITIHTYVDGSDAVISVQDQGVGIPAEVQHRIFERFFRVAETAQTKRGVGLGLAISKVIAEAHGGKMWFDSNLGDGSTFYLSLPIVSSDQ